MERAPEPRVAIIGVGQSDRARSRPDVDYAELASEAIGRSLGDAGVHLRDVNHAVTAALDFVDGRTIASMSIAEVAGTFLKAESRLCGDGTSAILYALAKMRMGELRCGLVVAHVKESQGRHHDIESAAFDPFMERRLGPDGDVVAGLAAQRWYASSGTTPLDAARAVVAARRAGMGHPTAVAEPLGDPEQVLTSDPLALPIRQLDKALRSDGATALVLATEDAVPDGVEPVWIAGGATRTDAYWRDRDLAACAALEQALEATLQSAGWTAPPDVVEYSAQYGFRAVQYEQVFSRFPGAAMTPSGGWLAGGAQVVAGLDRVADGVRQLRGTAGSQQRPGAQRVLAHGVHGLGDQTHTLVALEGAAA